MSRNDFSPDIRASLDVFTVPSPRADFAERIVTAATQAAPRAVSKRDRRGGWRIARRVMIGTVAAGMVSAAAVASGLLGAAGIRVPVLTAMLAPSPVPTPKPKSVAKPVHKQALATRPPIVATQPADPGLVDPGPLVARADAGVRSARAIERRFERRAERRAFVQAHPELKPVIRQAMQQQRAFVQANPEVRELWRMSPVERRAYLAQNPDLRTALKARQAERRALAEANPEAAALLRDRMRSKVAERRAARRGMLQNGAPAPESEGNMADPR
jgi:hypothetical protein